MRDSEVQDRPSPALQGTETVLVVDDLEEVRSFLNNALGLFGYSVICAEDGRDGLTKYIEHKDKIHAMLLDVVMPKLNGMELFKEVSKVAPHIKVLFMTGDNEILDRNDLQDKMKYIAKPFAITALLKALREVLDN